MANDRKKSVKKVKKRINLRFLVPFLLLFIAAAAAIFISSLFYITTVSVKGVKYADRAEIVDRAFPEGGESTLFTAFTRSLLYRDIPEAFTDLTIDITGLHSCMIRVSEKEAVFESGIGDMYLVFDKDGVILGVTSENPGLFEIEDLPIVSYCLFEKPEIDEEILQEASQIAMAVEEYEIEADYAAFKEDGFVLYMGDVAAGLGTSGNIREKMAVIRDQRDVYTGLSGTIHLENYVPGETSRFYFEIDTDSYE